MSFESIQEMFCRTADRFPARVAIDRGGKATTYREIEEKSNRVASHLLASGAAPGEAAALLIEDPSELTAALIGCLKARCMFVPFDVATPGRRLSALLADLRPRWFLVEAKHKDRPHRLGVPAAEAAVVCVDGDDAGLAAHQGSGRVLLPPDPDDRSYIFFTSGSSGAPKGIVGRLRAIDHFIRWEIETFGLGEGTRVSQLTTPAFDAVLRDLFVPLCCGGTACAPASREVLLDPRRLADWIDEAGLHLLHCVPSLFRRLLSADLGPERFPGLRHVLLAGEPLLPADVARWTRVFGDRVELVNLYGPSETTMTKLFYRVQPGDGELSAIPIGKPMRGAAALVIDERGRPCSPGQIGEILIRTSFRAHGYWNRPDLTDRAFVPNPFGKDPADRVYRTGDLARVLEDGNFVFLGRADEQMKIRGVRIEPAEIERLLRQHEAVRDVAVSAYEKEGEKVLCAYLTLREPVAPGTWRELLAGDLPEAMIPSHFVVMEELPRTLSGKIDRKALPIPQESAPSTEEAPRSPTEELVAAIFKDVLRVERIGIRDNFFEQGGHSLLAIQALARVQQAFEIDLPLGSLFEQPTVAGLARLVEQERPAAGGLQIPPLVRLGRHTAPLSFSQQRLWFMDQLQPETSIYNISAAVTLDGRLDVAALRRALDGIVLRHESLRTVFSGQSGLEPVQVIRPAGPLDLLLIDLQDLPQEVRTSHARALIAAATTTPFDLARGPLLRCRLLRLAPEVHALSWTLHHIISDGLSSELFIAELVALYASFQQRRSSPLPELPLQYTDFAIWQRQWLQGEALEAQLAYWREKLAGAPPTMSLPADHPRPAVQSFRGGRRGFALSPDLSDRSRRLSLEESCSLFMTLLASFQALLHCLSGEEDVIVGAPVGYRDWAEIRSLIGFFVNTLVFRTDLSGNPSFRELLGRVRRTCLEAFAHEHVPFEKLVEELQPVRSLSHNPLFQVGFTFHNAKSEPPMTPGLKVLPFELPAETTQFDLNLILIDTGRSLLGVFQYSRDLFEEISIAWFQEQLEALLERVTKDPDLPLTELRSQLAETRDRQWSRAEGALAESTFQSHRSRGRRAVVAVVPE